MALARRMAVTLPAGPKLEQTIARIRWAEDNGYPDGWFSDSGRNTSADEQTRFRPARLAAYSA